MIGLLAGVAAMWCCSFLACKKISLHLWYLISALGARLRRRCSPRWPVAGKKIGVSSFYEKREEKTLPQKRQKDVLNAFEQKHGWKNDPEQVKLQEK